MCYRYHHRHSEVVNRLEGFVSFAEAAPFVGAVFHVLGKVAQVIMRGDEPRHCGCVDCLRFSEGCGCVFCLL